jgi:hypothetical protein
MTEAVSPIEHILQQIGELDWEGKEVLFEVLEKRIIEERRTEIAENRDETMKAYHQGTLKSGSPDDLFADLDI